MLLRTDVGEVIGLTAFPVHFFPKMHLKFMLPSPILSSSANSTFCFALFCFVLFPLFCSPSSCILIPCSELLCSLAKHQALFCQDIPHVIPALARWKSHILNAAKVSFAFQRKSDRIFHERVKAFPRLNQPNLGWRS